MFRKLSKAAYPLILWCWTCGLCCRNINSIGELANTAECLTLDILRKSAKLNKMAKCWNMYWSVRSTPLSHLSTSYSWCQWSIGRDRMWRQWFSPSASLSSNIHFEATWHWPEDSKWNSNSSMGSWIISELASSMSCFERKRTRRHRKRSW